MHYSCTNCGNTSVRWEGRCSACGEWGSYEEVKDAPGTSGKSKKGAKVASQDSAETVSITSAKVDKNVYRRSTGIGELDRVLGGGFVQGEVVLLSGEPGVGKSTLLLQVSDIVAKERSVLYVSGEESISQLWGRYKRLGVTEDFEVTAETDIDSVINTVIEKKYDFVVIDSIQALVSGESTGFPGSISQVRLCGSKIVDFAKRLGVTVVIVGQITKSGSVAGPKILEHMVDCVLHMEGDADGAYKLLRAGKNRFGSTKELGVFSMGEKGLEEVKNPSEIFTEDYTEEAGTCIGGIVEGSRVMMIEVQALVVEKGDSQAPSRRVASGLQRQRLEMLCAVLSQKGAVFLGDKDVYVNISGASSIYSSSLDLAVCAAIKSAVLNKPHKKGTLFVGELSLTGGVKSFFGIDQVAQSAKRLGYKGIYGPLNSKSSKELTVKTVRKISQI